MTDQPVLSFNLKYILISALVIVLVLAAAVVFLLFRKMTQCDSVTIPVETDAPESVHIGLTRSINSPGEYIFSLVNTTSGPTRPLRSLQPVSNINVKLNLEGKSIDSYKILRSQGNCSVNYKDRRVEIDVDRLEDYFSVYISMRV